MNEFFGGLALVLEPETIGLMLLGAVIGLAVGLLPGLGGPVALALMLPFTFGMEPVQVFAFLLAMHATCSTAGDVTSVLFGIPGEGTTAASVLDGYPMTKQGRPGRALGIVLTSSALGGLVGVAALALSVPVLRELVLALGPPDFLMLTLLGLAFVVGLSGRNLLKGFAMVSLGVLIAMVGLDPQEGVARFTFDSLYLWDGIGLVPVVVGLFGGAEVIQLMLSKNSIAQPQVGSASPYRGLLAGAGDTFRHWWLVLRCSGIGLAIGAIPGMGGSVAQWIAYGHAQQTSKNPEKFGRGATDGLVAAGANNNAKDAGALIPTVALGIPGGVSTAILLGAFLIAGLNPGHEMLTTELEVTFSMVWVMALTNIVAVLGIVALLGGLTRLTTVRGTWLVPFLLVLLALGAYTSSNSMSDIVVMLVATTVGVVAIRWDWPRVPLLLGIVLGALVERYLFLSYSLDGWSWLTEPRVLVVAALILLTAVVSPWRKRRRARRAAAPGRSASTRPVEAVPPTRAALTDSAEGGRPSEPRGDEATGVAARNGSQIGERTEGPS
jgi:putative tricarboxylic transport membrane protein